MLTDLGPLAVLVLGLVIFAETGLLVGFFLPGDSLLFTAGLLVTTGVLQVPLAVVIVSAWAAGAVGDQVGYWIGGRLAGWLLAGGHSRWVSARHINSARTFFHRHGHKAVILARFVPVVRTFTPLVAGAVDMPRRRFTLYNVVGGLLWTAGMSLAGYYLGGVSLIADHVDVVTVGIVCLSLVPPAFSFLGRRGRRGSDAQASGRHLEHSSATHGR